MSKIHRKLKQNSRNWVKVLVYNRATQTDLWNDTVYKLFILCLQQEKYRQRVFRNVYSNLTWLP